MPYTFMYTSFLTFPLDINMPELLFARRVEKKRHMPIFKFKIAHLQKVIKQVFTQKTRTLIHSCMIHSQVLLFQYRKNTAINRENVILCGGKLHQVWKQREMKMVDCKMSCKYFCTEQKIIIKKNRTKVRQMSDTRGEHFARLFRYWHVSGQCTHCAFKSNIHLILEQFT